jgi:hypothetical protein
MTEAEVIQEMRRHLDTLFPKVCPKCGRSFATLREYILTTKPHGAMMSYDAELGEWEPRQLSGTLALANCSCGNTLALSTEGMPLDRRRRLLQWIGIETQKRRLRPRELLDYLRRETRRQLLSESGSTEAHDNK